MALHTEHSGAHVKVGWSGGARARSSHHQKIHSVRNLFGGFDSIVTWVANWIAVRVYPICIYWDREIRFYSWLLSFTSLYYTFIYLSQSLCVFFSRRFYLFCALQRIHWLQRYRQIPSIFFFFCCAAAHVVYCFVGVNSFEILTKYRQLGYIYW